MLSDYIAALLARATAVSIRFTDGLQIAAASLVPLAYRLSGLKMPDDITTTVLAYIGMAMVSFVVIRLVFVGPYLIWKDERIARTSADNLLQQPDRTRLEMARAELLDSLAMLRYLVSELPLGDRITQQLLDEYNMQRGAILFQIERVAHLEDFAKEARENLGLAGFVVESKRQHGNYHEHLSAMRASTIRLSGLKIL